MSKHTVSNKDSLSLERVRTGVELLSTGVDISHHVPIDHGRMGVPASTFDVSHAEHVVREGGVLRYAEGTPEGKGGQIVAHLRDVGSRGQSLGLPPMGGDLLGALTGIGAVASVANLAVSAVGFYKMNQKLNQLQREMQNLHDELERLHETVRAGFQRIEERLVQIEYALEGLQEGQKHILEGQEDIKDQLDASAFGKIGTIVERLDEYRRGLTSLNSSRVERYRDTLADVRNRLEILVDRWCRGDKSVTTPGFSRGTGYYQVWAMALAVEARMLREVGRTRAAAALVERKLKEWYMPAAQDTVALLVNDKPGKLLSGAFDNRIDSNEYLSLLGFRRGRPFDASERELVLQEADLQQKEVFGRTPSERARSLREYDPSGDYARAIQARKLQEIGRRLDTMALEYNVCARRGIDIEDWERRELAEEESGELHVIPVESR